MKPSKIILSEGNRPLWQLIIAAVHFTAIISILFIFVVNFEFTTSLKKLKGSLSLIELAVFLLPSALAFSVVKDVHFDLAQKRYKEQYCVGPIKVGKWKKLPNIEYVSVFRQPKVNREYIYEANLWYQKNKHFNIYENEQLEIVIEMGKYIAKALGVNLLDATRPNDFRWFTQEELKS